MRVKINKPEIAALRLAAEDKFGCPLRAPRHFTALSFEIEETTKEYLSETTLQRLWQYKAGYPTAAIQTLNVLCHYLGISDWEAFCSSINDSSGIESQMRSNDGIDIDSLKAGTRIRFGWLPDRLCVVKYLGDHRFEAVETHNSKLCVGDTFTCINMQKGREMCLDRLKRKGQPEMSYVIGTRNGLTSLEIVNDCITLLPLKKSRKTKPAAQAGRPVISK